MATELDDARVVYLPKISLADVGVLGVSVGVQRTRPENGTYTFANWEQAVDALGSADELLDRMLGEAFAVLAGWVRRGLRMGVAIPLTARQLASSHTLGSIDAALLHHRVDPGLVSFEIDASLVSRDPTFCLAAIDQLHARGFGISIDNFGLGISSTPLRSAPIDEIKISSSSTRGMISDPSDLAVVRRAIEFGHSRGIRVVATGVEDDHVRDALRQNECDGLQGNLLSRPLIIEILEVWFAGRIAREHRSEWPT